MIKVADLKSQTGKGPHPILLCQKCGAENSANKGDYFAADPSWKFTCCNRPMQLVVKRTIYESKNENS